jgi:outer membrane lipoprotein LolB
MSPRRRLWLAAPLVLLLGACATPLPPPVAGQERWSGRLALQVESDQPRSYSAGFELLGSPQAGELQLTSPLGQTLASVRWSPQGAELLQGQQRLQRASLDELTAELTGTALPVAALFAWLRGQEAAAGGWVADLSRQADGRLSARREQPLPQAQLRIVFQP